MEFEYDRSSCQVVDMQIKYTVGLQGGKPRLDIVQHERQLFHLMTFDADKRLELLKRIRNKKHETYTTPEDEMLMTSAEFNRVIEQNREEMARRGL